MPDYRFITPARQIGTDLSEFFIAAADVAHHTKEWGFTLTNPRLKGGKLTFTCSGTIPAEQMPHLDLENG